MKPGHAVRPSLMTLASVSAALLLAACKQKEQPQVKEYKVTPQPSAVAPATAPVTPPVTAPSTEGAGADPKAASTATLEAGPAQQSRYDRNARWLKDLASGDAARKAAVIEEMKKAQLPPAELAEFEKLRKYYGIK